jgi:hypothetical protein
MHKQPGDQADYLHSLEIRRTMYTAWRSDGLYTHILGIRLTMHTQPGDQMFYVDSLEI